MRAALRTLAIFGAAIGFTTLGYALALVLCLAISVMGSVDAHP